MPQQDANGVQNGRAPPRLLVVASEVPFPPIHGGRVDQWSRFRLFRSRGLRLMLAAWYVAELGEPSAADRAAMAEVFDRVDLFPISRTLGALWRRLRDLPRYSPHVSTRILRGADFDQLLAAARAFAPDAVWLDGLHGGETARMLATALGIPLFYRAHNVEFAYRRSQAQAALGLRDRIAWRLAGLHLERFETEIQRASRVVFDISQDDLMFWRSRGILHNQWAPTLVEQPQAHSRGLAARPWDVVYLGNLSTPNNLRGLQWFLERALPLIRRARPDVTVRIAGSRPAATLLRLAGEHGVDLCADPPDAAEILSQGRVLINPALSGSGLNVKSVEMLFHDAPIVTTPAGVRGLPADIRGEFLVAETPEEFARLCLQQLAHPYSVSASRIEARRRLGPAGIDVMIAAIENSLAGRAEPSPGSSAQA
jgi:hypothetical protein